MKKSKRALVLLISALIIALAFPATVGATVDCDINKDGKTDINDVTALQKYLVKFTVDIDTLKADVNSDNTVNVKDVSALQKQLNALPPITEIPKETEDIGDLI
jgi:hypothetical protein